MPHNIIIPAGQYSSDGYTLPLKSLYNGRNPFIEFSPHSFEQTRCIKQQQTLYFNYVKKDVIHFFEATSSLFYFLSFKGTYFVFVDTLLYAGRIILPLPAISSIRCAHQPTIRAIAKSGVYNSAGISSIR